jgi:hypothetical protein
MRAVSEECAMFVKWKVYIYVVCECNNKWCAHFSWFCHSRSIARWEWETMLRAGSNNNKPSRWESLKGCLTGYSAAWAFSSTRATTLRFRPPGWRAQKIATLHYLICPKSLVECTHLCDIWLLGKLLPSVSEHKVQSPLPSLFTSTHSSAECAFF